MTPSQKEVYETIEMFPNSSAPEIATLIGKTRSAVNKIIFQLEKDSIIKYIEKHANRKLKPRGSPYIKGWVIVDQTIENLVKEAAEKKTIPAKEVKAKLIKQFTETFDARKELEELRLWKQRAIMRFPELDVDPLILIAREMLAKHLPDQKQKNETLCGHNDKRPPMLAILELLESQGK